MSSISSILRICVSLRTSNISVHFYFINHVNVIKEMRNYYNGPLEYCYFRLVYVHFHSKSQSVYDFHSKVNMVVEWWLLLWICSFKGCFQSRRGYHGGTTVMSLQHSWNFLPPLGCLCPMVGQWPAKHVLLGSYLFFLIGARTSIARCVEVATKAYSLLRYINYLTLKKCFASYQYCLRLVRSSKQTIQVYIY